MTVYQVTDSDGNVSRIEANEEFVKAQYASYELEAAPTPTASEIAQSEKEWRDKELKDTDWIVAVTDHPQLAAYKIYRQELRDWPSTGNFPDTRPTLGG
tara:strand:+ start:151 stop:447 length:297 start_codon:yes stop_codon:yes gene_type:complete